MSAKIDEYINNICRRAIKEYRSAANNYPQPNYVLLKVAEEAGEVVKAGVHYAEGRDTWTHLEAEAVQTIGMCLRLLLEGDEVIGMYPPPGMLDDIKVSTGWAPPPVSERKDGLEVLAFHRGRWRHVRWSAANQLWHLYYGGPFITDGDRPFAPLPPTPAGDGFYDSPE